MQWKIQFDIMGGHVHCALFCAPDPNQTYAKCGDFVVRKGAEFKSLLASFGGASFIGNDPNHGCLEASEP